MLPSLRSNPGELEILRDRRVPVTLRTQRGEDIAAACGQLALEGTAGAESAEASP